MDPCDLERTKRVNEIITGIAKRASYKFKSLDTDDISQELWLHIIELEDRQGHPFDDDLISYICFRKIVDLQRYEMKRNHYSIEVLIESTDWDLVQDDLESQVLVDDLYRIFPEDSKERQFLEYWGAYSKVRNKDFGQDGKYNDGYTENDLARRLGFNDCAHRGYKAFRRRMREFVASYFGLIF